MFIYIRILADKSHIIKIKIIT